MGAASTARLSGSRSRGHHRATGALADAQCHGDLSATAVCQECEVVDDGRNDCGAASARSFTIEEIEESDERDVGRISDQEPGGRYRRNPVAPRTEGLIR